MVSLKVKKRKKCDLFKFMELYNGKLNFWPFFFRLNSPLNLHIFRLHCCEAPSGFNKVNVCGVPLWGTSRKLREPFAWTNKGEKQERTGSPHGSHQNRTPTLQTQSLIQQALCSLRGHCLADRGIIAFWCSNKICCHVSTPVCHRGQAGVAL